MAMTSPSPLPAIARRIGYRMAPTGHGIVVGNGRIVLWPTGELAWAGPGGDAAGAISRLGGRLIYGRPYGATGCTIAFPQQRLTAVLAAIESNHNRH